MNLHPRISLLVVFLVALAAFAALDLAFVAQAHAQKTSAGKDQPSAPLPADLFVAASPEKPVSVLEARKSSEEGKPIVVHGRIGGLVAPFSDKYAMFVLSDLQLAACVDGCATPWDYCCTPRETIMAGVATVQVVDGAGKPLKATLQGANGLKPMSEVIVRGVVAKRDTGYMVLNAQNIYVVGSPQ
jgi:hypothetical protein